MVSLSAPQQFATHLCEIAPLYAEPACTATYWDWHIKWISFFNRPAYLLICSNTTNPKTRKSVRQQSNQGIQGQLLCLVDLTLYRPCWLSTATLYSTLQYHKTIIAHQYIRLLNAHRLNLQWNREPLAGLLSSSLHCTGKFKHCAGAMNTLLDAVSGLTEDLSDVQSTSMLALSVLGAGIILCICVNLPLALPFPF